MIAFTDLGRPGADKTCTVTARMRDGGDFDVLSVEYHEPRNDAEMCSQSCALCIMWREFWDFRPHHKTKAKLRNPGHKRHRRRGR